MTNSQEYRNPELTFAQREGKALLPESMQLEHVPQKFRQLAWAHLEQAIHSEWRRIEHYGRDYETQAIFAKIIFNYKFHVQGEFHDTISNDIDDVIQLVQEIICNSEYYDVLTLIESIMQDAGCPSKLRDSLTETFNVTSIAYAPIEKQNRFVIVPRITRETGEAIVRALETLHEARMDSAEAHLHQASKHIHNQEYSDSIVDSIHSVESVARNIDPDSSKTLGPALASLEDVGLLQHPALKEAFKNLYGYTSDEQGLRHALIDKKAPNVGLDEAIFMFGACASFAAYLASKHRQMHDGKDEDT